MNYRRRLVAHSVNTLVFALLLAGCGGGEDDGSAAGGSTGQTGTGGNGQATDAGDSTGQTGTGGNGQPTGAGGSTGQTGVGGSSQPTGAGGSAAQTGSGGSGQPTGAGGSTGQTGAGGSSQPTGAGGSTGQTGTGGNGQPTGTGGSAPVEASCSTNVTPCGGVVVGTWTVTSSCLEVSGEVDMTGFGLGCSSASVTGSLEVTGSWTANADGTFSDNTTTSGNETLELPPECLNVSGTTTTCSRVTSSIASILGYASVDCVDSANGGCTCAATVDQTGGIGLVSVEASADGNYTTADNLITTDHDLQYSYCVAASTLTMTPQSPSPKTTTGTVETVSSANMAAGVPAAAMTAGSVARSRLTASSRCGPSSLVGRWTVM